MTPDANVAVPSTGDAGSAGRAGEAVSVAEHARENLVLTAQVTRTPAGGVLVEYAVRNGTSEEVGIFNRIAGVENGATVLRHAYVGLDGPELTVRAMELPLPERVQLTVRPTPFVTRVAAGETVRDSIVLAPPIVVFDPTRYYELYAPSKGVVRPTAQREASRVSLSVGVFRTSPTVRLQQAPGWPDAVLTPTSHAYTQSVLTYRATLSAPVQVLDWEVVFGRR